MGKSTTEDTDVITERRSASGDVAERGSGLNAIAGAKREGADLLPHPTREEIDLTAVLHALSDPMRLRVVAALSDGTERTCKSFGLPVVKSTCTHHFRVLREAGVIRQRLAGATRVNSLRREDLEARFPGLVEAVLRASDGYRQAF